MRSFELKSIIGELNIELTDTLFVSSDLSHIAKYCKLNNLVFDVNRFIDDLFELVIDGTLIVPAYTDNLFDGDTFDVEKSKPNIGALPNRVFRRKDFKRTSDALHSVFVKGKSSEALLSLNAKSTLGEGSVFEFLHQVNAKFLFINSHIEDSLTFVHYVEENQKVWYRRYYNLSLNRKLKDETEIVKLKFYSKRLGGETDFKQLNDSFVEKKLMKSIDCNEIKVDLIDAVSVYDETLLAIKNGPKLYSFSLLKFVKDFIKRYLLRRKGIL